MKKFTGTAQVVGMIEFVAGREISPGGKLTWVARNAGWHGRYFGIFHR